MTCEGCGIEYTRTRKDQRYHNRDCKRNAAGRRWRAKQPKVRHYCAAFGCGRGFERRMRGSRQIYCSRMCRVRANKATERVLAKMRRAA